MEKLPKHRAKKSLGQNFLNNMHVADQIVTSANLAPSDIVLEIGPGKGVLTERLLKTSGKVIAVEKDDFLIPPLTETFADELASGKLVLIHDDILTCDLSHHGLETSKFKLIANIPYYITGLLFRKFLEGDLQPTEMVVMVQKEVALRILARDSRESLLSISVKVYGEPSIVVNVSAGSFTPAPTIDSAVLKISNISRDFFTNGTKKLDEKAFFNLLRIGFAHKRKHLLGNLLTAGIKTRPELELIFEELHLPLPIRPENLSVQDWKQLFIKLS
jgi:16S rRNA (adenine1518-N6/adenine1519-N6)-dimethyltransferase